MEEEEFNALVQARPFGTEDAMRADRQVRRSASLGITLFGKTADDLRRQLLANFPEIPSGFDLSDFRQLLQTSVVLSAAVSQADIASETIAVGDERYTEWEARCEIVRRAIECLENR